ncbi:MAG: hypothetical protein ACI8W8_003469 [Rhodothermales bacterium]|jgi:hypothetical protein
MTVECLEDEAAAEVLEIVSELAARDQKVRSSAGACSAMLSLFGRYLPYRSFPGSVCGFQSQLIEHAI